MSIKGEYLEILNSPDAAERYIERYLKIITKPDNRGNSDLVSMKLWRAQRHYVQNRTHRDIVVKPRQVGFTTVTLADNSRMLFTHPYQRMAIITHDQETSEFLLQTVDRFHKNLPAEIKPEYDWKSGSRIRFPKLEAYIYIDSAKSDSVGIGHTLNIAHMSEFAKWPDRKTHQLFADITQTVPAGGYITIESTPYGRGNKFYELYDAAKRGDINYKPFFFPWWWDENYKRLVTKKLELTREELLLVGTYELTEEQIAFRREKIAELADLFFQEYPENDIDCWLSSEISVLDGASLRRYYPLVKEGKTEGNLTVWKDVIGGRNYKIGVDVAAGLEKGDYSVAAVLDLKSMEYVARLRGRIPPDIFAEQVYQLGLHYNQAEIGVEKAGHGHTVIRILLEKNYPNIYYHQDYDDDRGAVANSPGWKTNIKTKPQMVTDLVAAFRANDLISWSENLLSEAASLTWENEKKVRKPSGHFDDEWDAVSIAVQLREMSPIFDETKYGAGQVYSYVR